MSKETLKPYDPALPSNQQGLYGKFYVNRVDGSDQPGGKHDGCNYFVLDLDHDMHAKAAMLAYAAACELGHPELAADIRARFGDDNAVKECEMYANYHQAVGAFGRGLTEGANSTEMYELAQAVHKTRQILADNHLDPQA